MNVRVAQARARRRHHRRRWTLSSVEVDRAWARYLDGHRGMCFPARRSL